MGKEKLEIKRIVVVAETSEGKIYNVICNKKTQNIILNTISLCEGGINLLDKPLEGISIEEPFNKTNLPSPPKTKGI